MKRCSPRAVSLIATERARHVLVPALEGCLVDAEVTDPLELAARQTAATAHCMTPSSWSAEPHASRHGQDARLQEPRATLGLGSPPRPSCTIRAPATHPRSGRASFFVIARTHSKRIPL